MQYEHALPHDRANGQLANVALLLVCKQIQKEAQPMIPHLVRAFSIRIASVPKPIGSGLHTLVSGDVVSQQQALLKSRVTRSRTSMTTGDTVTIPPILLHAPRVNIELHANAIEPYFTEWTAAVITKLKPFLVDAKVNQEITITLVRSDVPNSDEEVYVSGNVQVSDTDIDVFRAAIDGVLGVMELRERIKFVGFGPLMESFLAGLGRPRTRIN